MEMRNLVKCSVIGLLSFLSLSSNVSAAENFTLGDINNDGYITNNDRYSLNEYLSSTTRSISGDFNHDAADIDRDGMITENDSTILTRYLAGWEGYEDLSAFAVELEIVNLSVDQSMLMTGETVTISAESNRSAEELVYTADVYLDNTKIDSIVGNSILKYIPSQSGVYSFDVRIKDSVSGTESAWYLDRCVDVFPYWALKGIELSTTKSEVGSTVTFSAKIDGNSDGLEYQFTLYKDDKIYYENPITNSPSFSFPVIEAGIYSVSLSVGDSYDYNGWHMFSDNVNVQSPATENPKLSVNYGTTLNVDELHEKDYDEVIINAKNTTIVWDRLSTDATYEIYISGPNGYSVHFEDYTSNSYTIPASSLKPGYEYEVDLERYDSSGKRISSGWRYFEFTVFGAESILLEKAPEILVPVTRQTYLYNDLTIQWKKMNYATKYELVMQYNCGNKWHDVIKNQLDKNKTSYTFSKDDLHPGCEHRVYIYAYDALGNKLDDRNNFYIEGDESTCRLIDPVITSHDFYDTKSDNVLKTIPLYGDIAVTWDEVPAASYYSLEIRDETTREYLTISGLDHIQNTEHNIPVSQLVSGRIYRVSVNAHHTDSCSRDSETMYFRAPYTGNRVLNPPKLVSHEFSLEESDPTVITKQDLTLEWEPVTAAVKYDINWYWLSDADYPDFYSYGKKNTTITIPSEYVICGEDEHYVLSIVAYDANGNTSSNEYYVRPLKSTIAAPVLLSPSFTKDSSADYPAYSEDDISILWGEVSGAVKYRVKLYDYYDGEWDEIWVKEDITNLTCVIPERELYSGGLFRIRITAYDKYGNGKISEPYYFQIGSSKYINLTRSDWEAHYEESHKYITVETAGDWTATASDSWIKLSQKSGEATTRIKVNVNANNGNFARSGSVTFKNSSGGYAVFSITQAPNNSSSTGALKITAPEYGSTADYGKITAKWSYNYDYAYFNVQLKNITTGKTVYENDTVINKTDTIPVSALAYGHTYQLIVSAYNASYVKVSESSSVFRIEDFAGSLPEEDDTDNPEIVEPEISVGENKIVLSGITDGATINLSDISLSWLNVINAEYYNVALRDITEYPDGTADDKIVKILDKTTRIQTEKISSSLLTRGHQYRVWVGAHTADKTLITGKSVTFTVKESVTSDSGTPSTDFDTGVLNLAVGETFDFEGTVYANGGTLEQIRVTVREASTGNFCDYAIYDAAAIASFGSTSAFDLSNIYRISTGIGTNIGTSGSGYADAGSQTLELTQVGSRYSINVYAKNANGKMILLATKDIVLIAEPFVRIYDAKGDDLNGTTINVGYSAFSGKTVYVETNVNISAWNDSSNAFKMSIVDILYSNETTRYTYSLRGTENPYAYERTGELRIYETTSNKVSSSSVQWASVEIIQAENPDVVEQIKVCERHNYNSSWICEECGYVQNGIDKLYEMRDELGLAIQQPYYSDLLDASNNYSNVNNVAVEVLELMAKGIVGKAKYEIDNRIRDADEGIDYGRDIIHKMVLGEVTRINIGWNGLIKELSNLSSGIIDNFTTEKAQAIYLMSQISDEEYIILLDGDQNAWAQNSKLKNLWFLLGDEALKDDSIMDEYRLVSKRLGLQSLRILSKAGKVASYIGKGINLLNTGAYYFAEFAYKDEINLIIDDWIAATKDQSLRAELLNYKKVYNSEIGVILNSISDSGLLSDEIFDIVGQMANKGLFGAGIKSVVAKLGKSAFIKLINQADTVLAANQLIYKYLLECDMEAVCSSIKSLLVIDPLYRIEIEEIINFKHTNFDFDEYIRNLRLSASLAKLEWQYYITILENNLIIFDSSEKANIDQLISEYESNIYIIDEYLTAYIELLVDTLDLNATIGSYS